MENLTAEIIGFLEGKATAPEHINALLNCIAIEMACACDKDPLSDEVCGLLMAAYVDGVKHIEQLVNGLNVSKS